MTEIRSGFFSVYVKGISARPLRPEKNEESARSVKMHFGFLVARGGFFCMFV